MDGQNNKQTNSDIKCTCCLDLSVLQFCPDSWLSIYYRHLANFNTIEEYYDKHSCSHHLHKVLKSVTFIYLFIFDLFY